MENTDKNFQDEEIWKEIQGFEGEYAISNKGNVKNLKSGRILGGGYDSMGYKQIKLKGKKYLIHSLVALAFIPNPYNLPYINHKNEIKDDNEVSNLEWCTASYNTNYSIHKRYRKVRQLTKDGKLIRIWESSWQINRETGYDASIIIKCCRGKRKQAYGYRWEYLNSSFQRIFNRPVIAFKGGKQIGEFANARKASEALGLKYRSINCVLQGRLKSNKGYQFKYLD